MVYSQGKGVVPVFPFRMRFFVQGGSMSQQFELYKCEKCLAVVEVFQGGGGTLVCCGEPMTLLKEGVTDAAREKHVPVAEKTAQGIKVKVGAVAHPMEEKHRIQWVELVGDDFSCTRFLKPGDAPEVEFKCACKGKLAVREYCNLHGHWKTEV
jgi:superoxide reductase